MYERRYFLEYSIKINILHFIERSKEYAENQRYLFTSEIFKTWKGGVSQNSQCNCYIYYRHLLNNEPKLPNDFKDTLLEIFKKDLERTLKGRFYPEYYHPTYDGIKKRRNFGIIEPAINAIPRCHYGTRDFTNPLEPYMWRINVYCRDDQSARELYNLLIDFIEEYPNIGFQFKPWGEPESFCLYFEDNYSLT